MLLCDRYAAFFFRPQIVLFLHSTLAYRIHFVYSRGTILRPCRRESLFFHSPPPLPARILTAAASASVTRAVSMVFGT